MNDYGHSRYISHQGIAAIGTMYVLKDLNQSLIPALLEDAAPPPRQLIILAGDLRSPWGMHPEEFMTHVERLQKLFPQMCLEEFLGYLAQVPSENILWRDEEDLRSRRLTVGTIKPRHRLNAYYRFLCERCPVDDAAFSSYLNRLGQFVDLTMDSENLVEPDLMGENSGLFLPLGYRMVWGDTNREWAVPYPCYIDRARLLFDDLPEPVNTVVRKNGSFLSIVEKIFRGTNQPKVSRFSLLVD